MRVIDGYLHVVGVANLIANGYVPYLFRNVRKRNQFEDKDIPTEDWKNYRPATKGWGVFGSTYTTKIVGTKVLISTNSHEHMNTEAVDYSPEPDYFVSRRKHKDGNIYTVGYGRSSVSLLDRFGKRRLIRLRFGIGFAKPIYHGLAKITPANLASNLAEFSLIFNPATNIALREVAHSLKKRALAACATRECYLLYIDFGELQPTHFRFQLLSYCQSCAVL
ncbi:MAG: hypothetical protein HDT05_04980 [Bacteroidales bacterium]|nr:hypothetical protein [Bacteroidales bacterium]